jgi:hypothetical protein
VAERAAEIRKLSGHLLTGPPRDEKKLKKLRESKVEAPEMKSLKRWSSVVLANTNLHGYESLFDYQKKAKKVQAQHGQQKFVGGRLVTMHVDPEQRREHVATAFKHVRFSFYLSGALNAIKAICMLLAGIAACCYSYCCAKRNSCLKQLMYSPAAFVAIGLLINFIYNILATDALKAFDKEVTILNVKLYGLNVKFYVYCILIAVGLLVTLCAVACAACNPEKDEEHDREQVYATDASYGSYNPYPVAPLQDGAYQPAYHHEEKTTTTTTVRRDSAGGFAAPVTSATGYTVQV